MRDQVKICEGISDISDSYQGFLIDQWGTLHNGHNLFPDVLDTLKQIKSRGKQIILMTNSGKRSEADRKRLAKLGLTEEYFDHIVTSSETTWQGLCDRTTEPIKGVGEKCFLMNRHGDTSVVEGIDSITIVDDINDADFILLTGSDAPEKTIENYYDPLLKQASRKQLKMICANPEKVITINGQNFTGSGEIALRYKEFGGVVDYIGKPYPSIFLYAMSLFKDLYPSQIVMIGDSLANDIIGARNLDMDCALIANGVHQGAFSKVRNTADIHKVLATLGKNYGAVPTYFIPRFKWGKPLPDRKNRRKTSQ